MSEPPLPLILPELIEPGGAAFARLEKDYRRLADRPEPVQLPDFALSEYGVDLSARLGPLDLPHPFG